MIGEKLRELWDANGLFQRKIEAEFVVDIVYISRMNSNEKSKKCQN
jgi:hypothetical protein